jgi:hypothetical protein
MEHVEAFSILVGDAVSISIFGVSRDIDIGPIDSKKAVPLQGVVRRQCVGKVVEKFFKSLRFYLLRCWIRAECEGASGRKS